MATYQKRSEPRSVRRIILITKEIDEALREKAEGIRESVNELVNRILERELGLEEE
jgi:hypothetical protein